jgi:hypothetical protein
MAANGKKNENFRDEEYFDISEKIMRLSDELAEDIVLTNIGDQMEGPMDLFTDKINYVTLFRNKYSFVTPDNAFYDKNYIRTALIKVTDLVSRLLTQKYGVSLGTDLDFYFPDEYLKDMETLYEFFFIRHFDNLVDYFSNQLESRRDEFVERYLPVIQTEEHSKDVFVQNAKRKFKNFGDVVIMHFINEIIEDIRGYSPSAYVLFDSIVNSDSSEEYNSRMAELLENYGNKVVFEGDKESFSKYMSVLDNQEVRNEVRNEILMRYLEGAEIEETV